MRSPRRTPQYYPLNTLSLSSLLAKLLFLCILRSSTAFATNHPYARAFASLTPTPTFNIRLARQSDVLGIQRCNLATLPENYQPAFYANHLKTWPELAIVAEQVSPPMIRVGSDASGERCI